MSTRANPNDIPGFDRGGLMPPPPVKRRHALGLPAGSVRELLAFMVLGLLWAVAYRTEGPELPLVFVYLLYMMILILAHYFAAHGSSIRAPHVSEASPLGLPRGSVRFLLLAGFAGLVFWFFYAKRESESLPSASLSLPLIMLSAFFLGYLLSRMSQAVYGENLPPWLLDVEAWVALIAMIGLCALVLLHLFINRNVAEELRLDPSVLETIVAAMVGFYFGARS